MCRLLVVGLESRLQHPGIEGSDNLRESEGRRQKGAEEYGQAGRRGRRERTGNQGELKSG